MDDDSLSMWIVYDHPKDFPDGFIARRHEATADGPHPTGDMMKATSLEPLRLALASEGLTRMTRDPDDDPKIVEVWL
jgi:hypothetical protein